MQPPIFHCSSRDEVPRITGIPAGTNCKTNGNARSPIDFSDSNFHAENSPRYFHPWYRAHPSAHAAGVHAYTCIISESYASRTQLVVCTEMEPRWKVARLCLQTVKSWTRHTGKGKQRGGQKSAGFYGLRTAVSFIVPVFVDAPRRKKTLSTDYLPRPAASVSNSPPWGARCSAGRIVRLGRSIGYPDRSMKENSSLLLNGTLRYTAFVCEV